MKLQIKEFAALTGVSVRTLHYYDEIGLLRPAQVDRSSGYRRYDEDSLLRMQEILFYRELGFSLKRIAEILSDPHYDKSKALLEQKQLLILKKARLERLISAIDGAVKGENVMNAFDSKELDAYKAEAKERWGASAAYQDYARRTRQYSGADWDQAAEALDRVMAEFARCKDAGNAPDSAPAQELAARLQQCITAHYYACTKEILAGLGQMYSAYERFRQNIDRHGDGTAAYVGEAIAVYCGK